MRRVNWTLVIIAALILVGWIAWQTILSLAAETRSFLVGLLAGGFLIALSAMTGLILIARQQAAMIDQLRAHIGEAHRMLQARAERASAPPLDPPVPPPVPPPPTHAAIPTSANGSGEWEVEYDEG